LISPGADHVVNESGLVIGDDNVTGRHDGVPIQRLADYAIGSMAGSKFAGGGLGSSTKFIRRKAMFKAKFPLKRRLAVLCLTAAMSVLAACGDGAGTVAVEAQRLRMTVPAGIPVPLSETSPWPQPRSQ
jgi:hypothetical protein